MALGSVVVRELLFRGPAMHCGSYTGRRKLRNQPPSCWIASTDSNHRSGNCGAPQCADRQAGGLVANDQHVATCSGFWDAYVSFATIPAQRQALLLRGTLLSADDKPTGADPQEDPFGAEWQLGSAEDSDGSDSLDLARMASLSDHEASMSDREASASDQTSSDSDQTGSDSDQTVSDRDQTASEEDQAASDQEGLAGADQNARDMASVHRDHATSLRDEQARARLRIAVSRDITADERAQVASARDQIAEMRDAGGKARGEIVEPGSVKRGERAVRGALDRQRASDDRTRAADDRARAADDRARAAEERAQSARDRTLAARDRAQAALDREASETDELTHVRRRGAGMKQLQREVDRARRAPEDLVVTFVDVDGLKQVNDTRGHLAGDDLLVAVADSLRGCLRSYDLIMRFGGDEFVCALPNVDVKGVRQRFASVSKALAKGPTQASITVGFAELGDSDSAEDLIRRADADLLAHRERA
jgi:diguanylate cyclase (GGDEF)-like protein